MQGQQNIKNIAGCKQNSVSQQICSFGVCVCVCVCVSEGVFIQSICLKHNAMPLVNLPILFRKKFVEPIIWYIAIHIDEYAY